MVRTTTRGSCVGAKRGFQSTRNNTEGSQSSKRRGRSTEEDLQTSARQQQNTGNNRQGSDSTFNETHDVSDNEDFGENSHYDNDLADEDDDSSRSTRGPNRTNGFWKDPSQREDIHISGMSFEEISVPRTITSIIKGHIKGPWPTWGKVDKNVKDQLFKTFKDVYNWSQHDDYEIRRVWHVVCEKRYKELFKRARDDATEKSKSTNPNHWKKYKPSWIDDVYWKGCIRIWCSSDWQKKSEANKKNRASEEHGGPPKHRGGSVSAAVHLARWRKEHDGNDPTPYEFFDLIHKVEEGTYIDQKAQKTHEKYVASMEDKYGPDVEKHPKFDLDAWNEATDGPKKGRMYGLGSSELASQVVNAYRPSKGNVRSHGDMDAMRQKIEELEQEKAREMEEMRLKHNQDMEEMRLKHNQDMEKTNHEVAALKALLLGDGRFTTLLIFESRLVGGELKLKN